MSRPHRVAASVALVAILLTVVSACSIPSRPVWWPKAKASLHAAAPAASPTPVPTVAHPWHTGMPQLGIQVYWTANANDASDAVVEAKARRLINYAISLNANSIAITFPFYTYGIGSDQVYADPKTTPTPRQIQDFLAVAAQSNMRVTIRPILNEDALVAQNPNAWRGMIQPQSTNAWFQSYRQLLMPYVEAAQQGHAATFVIGAELDSLERDSQWSALVSALQSVYSGELVYDENFDEFAAGDPYLPLPGHNIDAYPRFNLPDTASVSTLTQAWNSWLGTHRPAVLHSLVLAEVGIVAVAGAYHSPGAWLGTTTDPIDAQVQANWYQAVCQAVGDEHVDGGIYWWEVGFDDDPADPAPYESDRLTFLGRPAEQVIRNCFAGLGTAS
jgi:hypothetical protein